MTVSTAQHAHHIIGGHNRPEQGQMEVINPAALDSAVGTVSLGTEALVDDAVHTASTAWKYWRNTDPVERGRRLNSAVDLIRAREDSLATTLTLEQGKPFKEALLEIRGSARILAYYADLASLLTDDQILRQDRNVTALEGLRPLGITGVIVPWNSPVYLGMLGIAPALLAGNSVIVKPSGSAPLALTAFLEELMKVLPEGVLNVVQGSSEVGSAIAAHPDIRKIFFTGSTEVGQEVLALAAPSLKRVSLELGGNDPAIILADTILDDAFFREMTLGVFTLSGQVCFNIKRIYVHQTRFDEFVERFTSAIDQHIVVGNGLAPSTTMGALTTSGQMKKVVEIAEDTASIGASVSDHGRWGPNEDPSKGNFLLPKVATGVSQHSRIVQEEQFGPIIPVLPFGSIDEAVDLANDNIYGLAASIWTRDPHRARRIARDIEAGSVFLNTHRIGASAVDMTFGGFKRSGLGRGHGIAALRACCETQLIADWADPSDIPAPY